MNAIRKFLPPIALVSALALVPVTASSFAAATRALRPVPMLRIPMTRVFGPSPDRRAASR